MTESTSGEASQLRTNRRVVTLVFDRDIANEELEQFKQRTDALVASMAPMEAAHHHDVTPMM